MAKMRSGRRPGRRVSRGQIRFAVAIFLAAVVIPGIALATNTHHAAEWWNGLGDGTDYDSYLHPFNDSDPYQHAHDPNTVALWRGWPGVDWRKAKNSCSCQHSHISWDVAPTLDCKFYSKHYAGATASSHDENTKLIGHNHYHHDGACW
jgi:hypothetical protein